MKREIIYYLVLLILISGLIFIETNTGGEDEVNISKVIEVDNFKKLEIDLSCNIYVSIGEEQRVVLEGPEGQLNKIETEFKNGILRLTEKTPAIFNGFLGNLNDNQVNLYLKLTSTDQLIKPTKGTLITNESSFNNIMEKRHQFSLNQQLLDLLKLVGQQTGFIFGVTL